MGAGLAVVCMILKPPESNNTAARDFSHASLRYWWVLVDGESSSLRKPLLYSMEKSKQPGRDHTWRDLLLGESVGDNHTYIATKATSNRHSLI